MLCGRESHIIYKQVSDADYKTRVCTYKRQTCNNITKHFAGGKRQSSNDPFFRYPQLYHYEEQFPWTIKILNGCPRGATIGRNHESRAHTQATVDDNNEGKYMKISKWHIEFKHVTQHISLPWKVSEVTYHIIPTRWPTEWPITY